MTHLFREAKVSDGWLCLKVENRLMARQEVAQMKPGAEYEIEFRRRKRKRSLDANAYAWVLMGKLSAATGIPTKEIYREYVPDIGDNAEQHDIPAADVAFHGESWTCRGLGWIWIDLDEGSDKPIHSVLYYKGSSKFDTQQMSRLIDLIIYDCKENEIETLTPDELDRMKGKWDAKTDKGAGN